MSKATHCDQCGAPTNHYPISFTKGFARVLWKMAQKRKGGQFTDMGKLDLTKFEYANYPKMRHWGLIERPQVEDERGGKWRLTPKAMEFLMGRESIKKTAILFRNKVVRFEGDRLTIDQVTGGHLLRGDYKEIKKRELRSEPV